MVDGKEQISIRFPNNVLDQFREYAMCEYKSIKEAIDMDLKPEEVIANFDNKDQGKYFSSLTGVYDKMVILFLLQIKRLDMINLLKQPRKHSLTQQKFLGISKEI